MRAARGLWGAIEDPGPPHFLLKKATTILARDAPHQEHAVDEVKWGTADGPTTVMIRNLPNGCSVSALALQIRLAGFAGLFHDVHSEAPLEQP